MNSRFKTFLNSGLALSMLAAFAAFLPASAQAGLQIRLNPSYEITGSEDGEVVDPLAGDAFDTWRLTHRLDLGWKFDIGKVGIPIGASWFYDRTKTTITPFDTTSSPNVVASKTTAFGLWTGIEFNNFDLDFVYYFSPTRKDEAGGNPDNFRKGSGWELGLGYMFQVSPTVGIGPRYVYRRFSWDERESGGTVDAYNHRPQVNTESQLMLGIEFEFGGGGRRGR